MTHHITQMTFLDELFKEQMIPTPAAGCSSDLHLLYQQIFFLDLFSILSFPSNKLKTTESSLFFNGSDQKSGLFFYLLSLHLSIKKEKISYFIPAPNDIQ